jgi:hypothetical protein
MMTWVGYNLAMVSSRFALSGWTISVLSIAFLLFDAIGVLVWAGLHLRDDGVRAVMPLQKRAS